MKKRTQLCIAIGLAIIVLAVLVGIIISVLNGNKQPVTHSEDHIVSAAFIVGHIPEHADTGVLANYTYVTQATPKNTAYVKSDELNSFVSVPTQLALLITTKDTTPFTDDRLSALTKAVGDATKNHDVTQLDINAGWYSSNFRLTRCQLYIKKYRRCRPSTVALQRQNELPTTSHNYFRISQKMGG